MNLQELKLILEGTGYPVAYSDFKTNNNHPLPQPPFICYVVSYSSNFFADNNVYKKISNIQIELYTAKKDLAAEANLESVLEAHEIPFETSELFIESERLFQKIYEARLI